VQAAIEMRPELRAFFADHAPLGEAEHLEAAAVGEHRARPADKPVQAAAARDQVVAGTEKQVVGVAEDDLRAERLEIGVAHRLHRALRADRHERRRLDHAVRRAKLAPAGGAVGVRDGKAERRRQRLY
jgi:hypothetical protein